MSIVAIVLLLMLAHTLLAGTIDGVAELIKRIFSPVVVDPESNDETNYHQKPIVAEGSGKYAKQNIDNYCRSCHNRWHVFRIQSLTTRISTLTHQLLRDL
jgi:hypothetical protein